MKVLVTTTGDDLSAPLDGRFGRAAKFIIYDVDHDSFEVVDNAVNLNTPQGAGVQAAEVAARHDTSVVITGHCGPKAFRALSAAAIKVYNTEAPTVKEALELFRSGQLKPAESADVEGHW